MAQITAASVRSDQLADVWHVARARYDGQPADLSQKQGPLSEGSLRMYLQSLKEMFLGQRYTRAMKNDDTEYFLTRFTQDLGPKSLGQALSALDLHIKYYNTLGKGELVGARNLHRLWSGKSASTPRLTDAGHRTEAPLSSAHSGNASPHLTPYSTTLTALLSEQSSALAAALARSPADRAARLAAADPIPKTRTVTTTVYLRNMDVVATVLLRAQGTCEACTTPAPFLRRADATPYLEVHHILPLAQNGPDTVENATALCPNCHRRAHHGPP